jgi:hypothetical protein
MKNILSRLRAMLRYTDDFSESRKAFTHIYDSSHWGPGSGIGSLPANAEIYADFLVRFLRNNGVTSVVDVGCGDWQFSRHIDWSGIDYTGYDVVASVVDNNRLAYARPGVTFGLLSNLNQLKSANVVICKDVLQHLPVKTIKRYLSAFRRKYTYSLITNDIYPDQYTNAEIPFGAGRALRLDLPPFSLPAPVLLQYRVEAGSQTWIKETRLMVGD